MKIVFLALPLFIALAVPALSRPPDSPEVHADGRVTLRLTAPEVKEVVLRFESMPPAAMRKDKDGVWEYTTTPLQPDIYVYAYLVDGLQITDPSNPFLKYNLISSESQVRVPGPSELPWELGTAPRGVVHHHYFHSAVVGDDRDFLVYTPPDYDPAAAKSYPVLYLLHGFSDDATAWTSVGRAHVILDNLIARGQARPMLVVMPLGYGDWDIIKNGWDGIRDADLRRRSYDKFRSSLLGEVIPRVEAAYHVLQGRENRAIAGLSMGGTESLLIGLRDLELFAWIGAFSSGGMDDDFDPQFPNLNEDVNARLRALWIACGRGDSLFTANQKLVGWLRSKGVRPSWIETEGEHSFRVWRRNLAAFAPLLFRERPSQ
jgi:enterochelin esterase-like enzyme